MVKSPTFLCPFAFINIYIYIYTSLVGLERDSSLDIFASFSRGLHQSLRTHRTSVSHTRATCRACADRAVQPGTAARGPGGHGEAPAQGARARALGTSCLGAFGCLRNRTSRNPCFFWGGVPFKPQKTGIPTRAGFLFLSWFSMFQSQKQG